MVQINSPSIKKLFHFAVIIFLMLFTAPSGKAKEIIVTLPADTVLSSLKKAMPIKLDPKKETIDGTIMITSIDSLQIKKDTIYIKGVVQGKDLSIISKIANQNIRLKLGQVVLPIACNLKTRFDETSHTLFISPTFQSQESNSLTPLFNALQKNEYQIPLKNLQLLDIELGSTRLPLTVSTTDITTKNNELTLKLQPNIQQ